MYIKGKYTLKEGILYVTCWEITACWMCPEVQLSHVRCYSSWSWTNRVACTQKYPLLW